MALKSKLATNPHRGRSAPPVFTWVTVRLATSDAKHLRQLQARLADDRGGEVTRAEAVRAAIRAAAFAGYDGKEQRT
jgi:hypothetical protein